MSFPGKYGIIFLLNLLWEGSGIYATAITIKDIARIAGVSTSTVSRALSNSPELSEQTRQRIPEICQREGYRVNALARSLICNKTNVIGLIVPEVTNPFYAELSLGIETHARSLGYQRDPVQWAE